MIALHDKNKTRKGNNILLHFTYANSFYVIYAQLPSFAVSLKWEKVCRLYESYESLFACKNETILCSFKCHFSDCYLLSLLASKALNLAEPFLPCLLITPGWCLSVNFMCLRQNLFSGSQIDLRYNQIWQRNILGFYAVNVFVFHFPRASGRWAKSSSRHWLIELFSIINLAPHPD